MEFENVIWKSSTSRKVCPLILQIRLNTCLVDHGKEVVSAEGIYLIFVVLAQIANFKNTIFTELRIYLRFLIRN